MSEPYALKPRKNAAEMLAERNIPPAVESNPRAEKWYPLMDVLLDVVDEHMLGSEGKVVLRVTSFIQKAKKSITPSVMQAAGKPSVIPWQNLILPWLKDLLEERGFHVMLEVGSGADFMVNFPPEDDAERTKSVEVDAALTRNGAYPSRDPSKMLGPPEESGGY